MIDKIEIESDLHKEAAVNPQQKLTVGGVTVGWYWKYGKALAYGSTDPCVEAVGDDPEILKKLKLWQKEYERQQRIERHRRDIRYERETKEREARELADARKALFG